jgi:hypothetical protein
VHLEDRAPGRGVRRSRPTQTADLRGFLMELAGLEPATSWVAIQALSRPAFRLAKPFLDAPGRLPQHLPQQPAPPLSGRGRGRFASDRSQCPRDPEGLGGAGATSNV